MVLCCNCSTPVFAIGTTQEESPLPVMPEPEASPAALVNEFICNSGSCKAPELATSYLNVQLRARLLTPLNAGFNKPGDRVLAVVSEAPGGIIGKCLPAGALLCGTVEGARSNGRLKQTGQLNFRFYSAVTPAGRLEVTLRPNTANGMVGPLGLNLPPSRKTALRNLFMTSSHIAIPLAIGSGGISIAITAGAGAVIGALLSDDHKYLRGAARGAWDASGLSVFDPLLFKAPQAIIPQGTAITLISEGPINLPNSMLKTGSNGASALLDPPLAYKLLRPRGAATVLSTAARIINQPNARSGESAATSQDSPANPSAATECVADIEEFLRQKNLAAAMQALSQTCSLYPHDPVVKREKAKLLNLVTGQPSCSQDRPQ